MDALISVQNNIVVISTHVRLFLTPRVERREEYRAVSKGCTSKGPLVPVKHTEDWVHRYTCVRRTPEEMYRSQREVRVVKRAYVFAIGPT